jgi:hypothetical protein
MFSVGAHGARPPKAKAAMVSRPDGSTPSSAGGLSATRLRACLAIFCQSFVGTSPAEAMDIGRRSTGGRRQVGTPKTVISAGQETACRPAPPNTRAQSLVNGAVAGEYFATNAWYVFVRISFCCVFEL